ncbi:aldo/keto reductase [Bacillus massiliigorillae]|uniref:aldo/keto reductase n=1 Tax=Bacillus massiliigorillae TaxID=1243664 RepID=UPI0003A73931|nr:aldo/keto reductase [Bacillus massiliigorillae]
MKKRKLGNSNLLVSEIGLGCMSLGTDSKKAEHIIHTALDQGINYFDTADLYDFGINEAIVGKTLKSVRDNIILATKVGNKWNEDKTGWTWDASKTYIKEAVKASLKRLQTDYIDLYQLHGGTMEDNHEEVIQAFHELTQEGLIRYYGISSIRPNVMKSFASHSDLVSVMMQYSILDRRPEEWMSMLAENNISIIARGPIAKGLLSNKMLEKVTASIKENGYLQYSYNDLSEVLGRLHETFASRNLLEVALQYILSQPTVGAIIPGASCPEQVVANVKAVQAHPLSHEELQFIRSLTIEGKYTQHRE